MIYNIVCSIITWVHWLDEKICSGQCYTNRFFGTAILYSSMLIGLIQGDAVNGSSVTEVLDALVLAMTPQSIGLMMVVGVFVLVESIALCLSFDNVIMRFVIVEVLLCIGYIIGVVVPDVAFCALIIVGAAYLLAILFVLFNFRKFLTCES